MKDLLAENAFIDAKSLAESIGREFVDADITQFSEQGLDLYLAACYFVEHYEGDNGFMKRVLMRRYKQYGKLTHPQARAAINILRQEHLGIEYSRRTVASTREPLRCFVCDAPFDTWDELNAHKSQEHGTTSKVVEMPLDDGTESIAVIENVTSVKGLDLTNLPDGRYCAPDPSGKNDYIFLMVKRVKRTHERDRRYVYGKIITGREVVVAGTIEVKIWSSDSKELIGEQKIGDVYRGQYEDELELIMMMPEPWAILFGKIAGHCCVCGKTLTDDESRAIGMGLDCERKEAYFKTPPKYSYVGTDRPDPKLVDPNDEKYLSGIWRSYQKPPAQPAS